VEKISEKDKDQNWKFLLEICGDAGCEVPSVKPEILSSGDNYQIQQVLWSMIKKSLELEVKSCTNYLRKFFNYSLFQHDFSTWDLDTILVGWASEICKNCGIEHQVTSIENDFRIQRVQKRVSTYLGKTSGSLVLTILALDRWRLTESLCQHWDRYSCLGHVTAMSRAAGLPSKRRGTYTSPGLRRGFPGISDMLWVFEGGCKSYNEWQKSRVRQANGGLKS